MRQIAEQLREPDGLTRCARSTSFSSRISTACSGSTCALSTPSTCSSGFSRARASRRSQPRSNASRNGFAGWIKNPNRPTGRGSANRFRATWKRASRGSPNLEKARENYELLQAEIENLETKIQSITELAINRSDAEAITGQVEQITQGLVRTEQTINDLGFATGGESFDLTVPSILSRDVAERSPRQRQEAPPRRQQDEIQFL